MAPMIDVVFQLLIFFMLTLKIVSPEGEFDVNMPQGQAPGPVNSDLPDLKIRLTANQDGSLSEVFLNNASRGADPQVFRRLNQDLSGVFARGDGFLDDVEIEIDADYHLQYQHVIAAIDACTATKTREGRVVPLFQKVKFAPVK